MPTKNANNTQLRVLPIKSDLLFQPTKDTYGLRLALSFGNENKGGLCTFYGSQCTHCEIGAGEGQRFDLSMNKARLNFFMTHYSNVFPNVNHLLFYNFGSILNPAEFSRESLKYVLTYAKSLETCSAVSLDSREMYITPANLSFVLENLRENQLPRAILGVETQDDNIRMNLLRKTMSRDSIEKAFKNVGEFGQKVGLDANILFQPPGIVGDAAIGDAIDTAKYCIELSAFYKVLLDLNFHPYYPSAVARNNFPDHSRASIKNALFALECISGLLRKHPIKSQLYIGWQDEGFDTEKDKRKRELDNNLDIFTEFNRSQRSLLLTQAYFKAD
jgi:hypothetical protein